MSDGMMIGDPVPCPICGRWKLAKGAGHIGEFCECDRTKNLDEHNLEGLRNRFI